MPSCLVKILHLISVLLQYCIKFNHVFNHVEYCIGCNMIAQLCIITSHVQIHVHRNIQYYCSAIFL